MYVKLFTLVLYVECVFLSFSHCQYRFSGVNYVVDYRFQGHLPYLIEMLCSLSTMLIIKSKYTIVFVFDHTRCSHGRHLNTKTLIMKTLMGPKHIQISQHLTLHDISFLLSDQV